MATTSKTSWILQVSHTARVVTVEPSQGFPTPSPLQPRPFCHTKIDINFLAVYIPLFLFLQLIGALSICHTLSLELAYALTPLTLTSPHQQLPVVSVHVLQRRKVTVRENNSFQGQQVAETGFQYSFCFSLKPILITIMPYAFTNSFRLEFNQHLLGTF